jgi:hypothetical protein
VDDGPHDASVSDWLLSLWITLIGADRIDLLGGRGAFVLTPYLALTPIVVVSELISRHRRGRALTVPRSGLVYALVTAALVTVVLFSVMDALDVEISSSRALLLIAEIGGTLTVVLLSSGRPHLARVLARGAAASLILFALFDVAETVWWIGRGPETLRVGTILVHFGGLQNAGPVPRLGGPVSDANRGGFVLLFYGLLIGEGERRPALRRFALGLVALFLIFTISRSAWLGAVAMMVTIMPRRQRVPRVPIVAGLLAVAAVVVLFLAKPVAVKRAVSVVTSPVTQRLSTNEGSAQSHLALIERGLGEATESLPNALVGLGYGNSHLVLQDVFPGNKYGNFHSMYVSMFAESGVAALLLTLVLLLSPLVAGGPWRPLIAGAVVFNVFYQTPTEPAFWFALAAAWMTMPSRAQRTAAPLVARGGRAPGYGVLVR